MSLLTNKLLMYGCSLIKSSMTYSFQIPDLSSFYVLIYLKRVWLSSSKFIGTIVHKVLTSWMDAADPQTSVLITLES
jgi:hypothetical protein